MIEKLNTAFNGLVNLLSDHHHFLGLTAIIFWLSLKECIVTSGNRFLIFIFYFLTVFLHELSHYLMSKLTYGQPVRVSLIPQKQAEGWIFGYVASANMNIFNAFLISFAPAILLLPLSLYLWVHWFNWLEVSLMNYILQYLLIGSVLSASLPSVQDIKVSFRRGSIILWALLINGIFILISPKYQNYLIKVVDSLS